MAGDRGQLAAPLVLLHDHDGQAVRRPGDLGLLTGRVRGVVRLEHQDLVRVLVVRHKHLTASLTGERQQRQEVVVVTELGRLCRGGLVVRVERGGAAEDGLAPADHDVLGVPVGDHHGVGEVGGDGGEAEAAGRLVALGSRRGSFGGRLRLLGAGADDGGARRRGDRHDGRGTHHRTAAQRGGDDVTDVLVVAGVRYLVETGVATAVQAGHGRPATGMRVGRSDQRQKSAHFCSPHAVPWFQRDARWCVCAETGQRDERGEPMGSAGVLGLRG